jgi:UDP-N-acetylmuramyl pentapeptide phosphotransferase/UDP-N-acetylglucosamine-1-phosphate transferase
LVKAVGGALLALVLGWRLHGSDYGSLLPAAALIALSANAINLLDLRPGRAGGVFLAVMLPLLLCAHFAEAFGIGPPLPLLVVLPALVVWERDARATVMMGDTGSNLLGGTLGLSLAVYTPQMVQTVALFLLVLLHIVAERVSLTRIIEGSPLLRTLDRLTGVR